MKLTKQDIEFLINYYKDKIQYHERVLKGYKIALKDVEQNKEE